VGKLEWQDTVFQGHHANVALVDYAVVYIKDPNGKIIKSVYFKKGTITWREDDEISPMLKWHPKKGFIKQEEHHG